MSCDPSATSAWGSWSRARQPSIRGDVLAQAAREPFQRRADVVALEMHVQNADRVALLERPRERRLEILLGPDFHADAAAEHRRQLVETPLVQVVEWAFLQEPLRRIALVVEHDHDRIEFQADGGRKFDTGQLTRPR